MVAECTYRRVDTLCQFSYCRAASNDSLSGILTFNGRGCVTCTSCPVPRLLQEHTCFHLELRPVIMPFANGNSVASMEQFCREDGVKLSTLESCGPGCAAYRLPQPGEERRSIE
jgi:hypothetical protein